ncbi:hypothetical protein WM04_24395 [Burkholderia ubonensis]|nr:hypothetical protein WM04_24395 [Burkholderia ubonensis]OJB17689.1 hypothetical protein BGV53_11195 [Burkholderia ubonensis]
MCIPRIVPSRSSARSRSAACPCRAMRASIRSTGSTSTSTMGSCNASTCRKRKPRGTWRGLVDERELSEPVLRVLRERFTFQQGNAHLFLTYLEPGRDVMESA